MSADVECGGIIVEGDVRGNLTSADRIEMKSTARYEGDLKASKLTVDEGAQFSGHVSVGPEAVKGNGRPPEKPGQQQAGRPGGAPAQPQAQPVK